MDILALLLALIGGFLAGIIINILADDLPNRRNPSLPHYPNDVPRPLMAWSGISAFLTGQRTGPEKWFSPEQEKEMSLDDIAHYAYDTQLSWRYPLTELAMMLLFGGIILFAPDHPRTLIWFLYLIILMLITVIDLEHRLILFIVIIPSVLLTLLINAIFPEDTPEGKRPFIEYILGGVLGGSIFFLMFLGGGAFVDAIGALRGRSINEVAFGFGDVMLAILCGCMIGWRAMVFAMFITVFAGAIGAILFMSSRLLTRGRYNLYTALPYGPYIVLGTVVMMLFIEQIRDLFGS